MQYKSPLRSREEPLNRASASGIQRPKLPKPPRAASSSSSKANESTFAIERPVQRHQFLSLPLTQTRSHVVQTIAPPRRADRRSPPERHPLADPVLRLARLRQRPGQASRGRLRPRRHLCHCFGTVTSQSITLYPNLRRSCIHPRCQLTSQPPCKSLVSLSSQPSQANTSQYTAAVKTQSLDSAAKALASLNAIIAKDPKLTTILSAPTLTQADKSQIIAELEKAAGVPSGDKTVKNLLKTLAENNRLSLLGGVCAKFGEIMSASRGEVEMVVTSATVGLFSLFLIFLIPLLETWIKNLHGV